MNDTPANPVFVALLFILRCLVPLAILVAMDFGRMMINRFRKPKPAAVKAGAEVPAESTVEPTPAQEMEPPAATEEKASPEPVDEPIAARAERESESDQTEEEETPPFEAAKEADQPEAEPEPPAESKSSDTEERSNDQ